MWLLALQPNDSFCYLYVNLLSVSREFHLRLRAHKSFTRMASLIINSSCLHRLESKSMPAAIFTKCWINEFEFKISLLISVLFEPLLHVSDDSQNFEYTEHILWSKINKNTRSLMFAWRIGPCHPKIRCESSETFCWLTKNIFSERLTNNVQRRRAFSCCVGYFPPEKAIFAVCSANMASLHGNLLNAENWLTIVVNSAEIRYLSSSLSRSLLTQEVVTLKLCTAFSHCRIK